MLYHDKVEARYHLGIPTQLTESPLTGVTGTSSCLGEKGSRGRSEQSNRLLLQLDRDKG